MEKGRVDLGLRVEGRREGERMFKQKYSNLLTEYENREYEKKQHKHGPLSLLYQAVEEKKKVLVALRNNRKIVADVVAYDKHFNLVLENALEIYRTTGKNKVQKERELGKMFLRGDNVILVVLLG